MLRYLLPFFVYHVQVLDPDSISGEMYLAEISLSIQPHSYIKSIEKV